MQVVLALEGHLSLSDLNAEIPGHSTASNSHGTCWGHCPFLCGEMKARGAETELIGQRGRDGAERPDGAEMELNGQVGRDKDDGRRAKKQDVVRRTKDPATIRTRFNEVPDGLIFRSEPKALLRVDVERAR